MVPGIEPTADPVLQSRLFSYPDTHRHRLGANYQQLPVNQPVTGYQPASFQRDGPMTFYNQGSRPNYLTSSSIPNGKVGFSPSANIDVNRVHGNFVVQAVSFLSAIRPEDFNAPRALWNKVFSDGERERWIKTVSGHMSTVKDKEIIKRQIGIFRQVDEDIASRLEKATGVKGYQTIKGMTFNGSGNAMDGNYLTANNVVSSIGAIRDNGAPVRAAKL